VETDHWPARDHWPVQAGVLTHQGVEMILLIMIDIGANCSHDIGAVPELEYVPELAKNLRNT
jgi:hypothetical protein